MKIMIGIPAYNEDKNILKILLSLKKITDYIVVCDDGSTDSTKQIVENLDIKLISHKKNLGYGEAIKSLINEAKKNKPDIFITFDADGQHRIEDIEKILQPIIENKADLVIGSRFLNNETDMPTYRKIGVKVLTKVTNATLKKKFTDVQSGFRAYNLSIIENIELSESGMGISTEILIKSQENNFRIVEVPIKILYEGETSTHNPVLHGTRVLISIIKYTSIKHPLKFYGIPSVIFLLIGLVFLLWTIQIYSEESRIVTNIALIALGSIILGVILMISSILLFSIITILREQYKKS